jgi:hypothetical protein
MDNERRKQLGYTLEQFQDLQRITGTAPGEDLPPFPDGEDFTGRKAIYQAIDQSGKYSPLFRWIRTMEIQTGHDGKKTSELFRDDPEAMERHWLSANTKEAYYMAIRASEKFIRTNSPEDRRIADATSRVFFGKLRELSSRASAGEWNGVAPSEEVLAPVLQSFPDLSPVPGGDRSPQEPARRKPYTKGDGLTQKEAVKIIKDLRGIEITDRQIRNWNKGKNTPPGYPGLGDAVSFRQWLFSAKLREKRKYTVINMDSDEMTQKRRR